MDQKLFVLVIFAVLGLALLSSRKEEWNIWGGENSNRAGFRLGHHEYGICVESSKIKVTCEGPEDSEESAGGLLQEGEVAAGDDAGVLYYMEFEKEGIRHRLDFGRYWGLEACEFYTELWKKRLSERKVACFHAERTRFPDEEKPGQTMYSWQLPLYHGWWNHQEPEVPINWSQINVINPSEKPFGSR